VNDDTWARAFAQLPTLTEVLLTGAATTLQLTAASFLLALVLGVLFAVLRTLPSRLTRGIGVLYVEVFRSIPVLTQLFVIYFGLASFGIRIPPLPAAILGFGLNGGAYLSEVFRAGIEAVHRGQLEAAFTIGMTRLMGTWYIVLPQAVRIVLPPLGNFAVGLLKDTSIASAVAAPEMSFRARMLVDQTYLSTQIYLLTALMYLAMSLPLSLLARRLERRMAR
jgi:polar amino acid transport system permease protein/cystine transport system permease protein